MKSVQALYAQDAAALHTAQTFLAFDFGHQRTGVATGSRLSGGAQALQTLHGGAAARLPAIAQLVAQWQPDALIVGLPLHPDGAEHDVSRSARKFARQLHHAFGKPVALVDERYSSIEAENRGEKALDAAAACIILLRFLQDADFSAPS